jgi:Flp pilus assembly protein TadD
MKERKSKAYDELLVEARRIAGRDLQASVQMLSELLDACPESVEVMFFYAIGLFRLKRYAEAIPHLQHVLEARPADEWASLSLFHSFLQTGRIDEARQEMKRFHSAGGESMEYRRFIKDVIRSEAEE